MVLGEWATTSAAIGRGNRLDITKEIHFPHSLGLLYSAFTYYTGFKVNSGEYKLMGLAPYGEPALSAKRIFDHLIDVKAGRLVPARHGLLRLLHRPHHDERSRFDELFGAPARKPEDRN
jgi:carbamoyltransferase